MVSVCVSIPSLGVKVGLSFDRLGTRVKGWLTKIRFRLTRNDIKRGRGDAEVHFVIYKFCHDDL